MLLFLASCFKDADLSALEVHLHERLSMSYLRRNHDPQTGTTTHLPSHSLHQKISRHTGGLRGPCKLHIQGLGATACRLLYIKQIVPKGICNYDNTSSLNHTKLIAEVEMFLDPTTSADIRHEDVHILHNVWQGNLQYSNPGLRRQQANSRAKRSHRARSCLEGSHPHKADNHEANITIKTMLI